MLPFDCDRNLIPDFLILSHVLKIKRDNLFAIVTYSNIHYMHTYAHETDSSCTLEQH